MNLKEYTIVASSRIIELEGKYNCKKTM